MQKAAAVEYDTLSSSGKYPNIMMLIDDYSVTRKTIKACINGDK